MNIEIEIKVKVDDFDEIKPKIKDSFIKKVHQIDEYYTPQHRNFFEKTPFIEFLRIRTQEDKHIFGYHSAIFKDGINTHSEEREMEIGDIEMFRQILEKLDFKKSFIIDKKREYYLFQDFEIALDYVEGLGNFIEVEVKNDKKSLSKEDCIKVLEDMNITFTTDGVKNYPEMMWLVQDHDKHQH